METDSYLDDEKPLKNSEEEQYKDFQKPWTRLMPFFCHWWCHIRYPGLKYYGCLGIKVSNHYKQTSN